MHGPKSILAHAFDLIESNCVQEVESLVQSNPDFINQPTFFAGGTLLHYAAATSVSDMVRMLLDNGFDANARGKHYGDTPLHAACRNARLDNVSVLLDRGAIVDVQHSHTNPLFGAIIGSCLPIVALLVDHGIDVNVRYTLESGANVNAVEFAELRGQQECADFIRTASRRN